MNTVMVQPRKHEAQTRQRGWLASLDLVFALRGVKTALVQRRHHGPLTVQRQFNPEPDGPCHVYLLHPPGGIVGGDELRVSVELGESAQALVTTPAATKFYRSGGLNAVQDQCLTVRAGGRLEWLPQETILFDQCQAQLVTRIDLEPGARVIAWDILCFGRPASGESYSNGLCRQRFEIWREQRPVLLDRGQFNGDSPLMQSAWGVAGYTVSGTLVATLSNDAVESDQLVETIRALPWPNDDCLLSATRIKDILLVRCLGRQAELVRQNLELVWATVRPAVMGRPACAPRIWNT